MSGQGRAIWKNGNVYEGEYQKNKRSVYGTFKYKDGSEYTGHWKDDKKHGQGVLKDKNGEVKKYMCKIGQILQKKLESN